MSEDKEKRATFTPGPWHCGQGNGEGSIFANNGKRMTCEKGATALHPICLMQNSFEQNEDVANARLIAAAPELHAQAKVLERLLIVLSMQGETGTDEALEEVRAVLAKVDGGEG